MESGSGVSPLWGRTAGSCPFSFGRRGGTPLPLYCFGARVTINTATSTVTPPATVHRVIDSVRNSTENIVANGGSRQ